MEVGFYQRTAWEEWLGPADVATWPIPALLVDFNEIDASKITGSTVPNKLGQLTLLSSRISAYTEVKIKIKPARWA
jgi:hypothetical protein